jgi:large subunit ribosomal protein L25
MEHQIAVDARAASGKQNRRLRASGFVPGVVYGRGAESVPVQVEAKTLETLYRAAGRTSIVQLQLGEDEPRSVIITGLQRHPLTGKALHVDFFVVDLKHEMEVEVPLAFTGEAPAVSQTGGTLLTNISRVRIRALPSEIPHEIAVDLSGLVDLDTAIHVRDLLVSEGVQVLADGDEMVAKVMPPRVEEEPVSAVEGELEAEAAAGEEAPAAEAGEPGGAPEPAAESAN